MNQGFDRTLEAEAILSGLADEEGASLPENITLDHQYVRILTGSGLDELLFLYRDELKTSLKARRMLGEMAWIDGRYRTSLLQSGRVVLSLLTTAAEAYRAAAPEWRFDIDPVADAEQPDRDVRYPGPSDGAADLIERILSSSDELSRWLDEEGLWSQLYLLSSSMLAEGYEATAESIWSMMVLENRLTGEVNPRPEAGQWGRLAARQLEEPFITTGSLSP